MRSSDQMKRIVVIGSSCAGKSTFAARLSELTGLKHIAIDELNFKPGWVERETSELRAMLATEASAEEWIIDGNYSKTHDVVWPRATNIFWLDYAFPVVLSRAVRRTVKRVVTQEEVCAGNRESFRNAFLSTESMIWWVIKSFHYRRRQIGQFTRETRYASIAFTRFARPSEAAKLLWGVGSGGIDEKNP